MQYFITAYGSILRFNAIKQELFILMNTSMQQAQWQLIQTGVAAKLAKDQSAGNDPVIHIDDKKFPDLSCMRIANLTQSACFIDKKGRVTPMLNLQHPAVAPLLSAHAMHEQLATHLFITAADINPKEKNMQQPERPLAFLRAVAAKNIRDMHHIVVNPVKAPAINSYSMLKAFAESEITRLQKPFVFFSEDKIKKIRAALDTVENHFNAMTKSRPEEAEFILHTIKEESYLQLGRDSGLFAALSMHRFGFSSKARNGLATKSLDNLAVQMPDRLCLI
jgi:hypothetical protein